MFNISSSKTEHFTGNLYIVATPIGNREDISLRAINTLKSVNKILAEDTRHSKQLLIPLGITTSISSLHAHNEADKSEQIIQSLKQGQSFALISDAGTPLINDPGYPLVKKARLNGIPIIPIPGPCALITALCASGVPCDSFTFIGFLPAKLTARREKLSSFKRETRTIIFYESTHRIQECLNDIADVLGKDCEIVLAKELTKAFETFVSGSCIEVINWMSAEQDRTKGEFVIILPAREEESETDYRQILSTLLAELPLKQAVQIACKLTGGNKNELYKLALEMI